MLKPQIIVVTTVLLVLADRTTWAQDKSSNTKPPVESLSKYVDKQFARWDRNHDTLLDVIEVDHVIEDHSVRARHAALLVSLRYHLTDKKHQPHLARAQLLKLVDDHDFSKSVDQNAKHLETIDRELFLPTDPDLNTFNQGRLNDCYLLSSIAAQAHRSPKAIREMIHPQVTGGFHVVYAGGQKIEVDPLTDGELLLGAKLDNRHGSWLAVLEKSYGIIRKHNRAKQNAKPDPKAGTEAIQATNWGGSGEIITLLTGHHAESLILNKSSPDQIHSLLAEQTKKRHLVTVGTSPGKAPPGIGTNHVYAILGYDSNKRHVHVFNPWGNNFTPKGQDSATNGFTTKNGHFTATVDQLHSVFSDIVYETAQPAKK